MSDTRLADLSRSIEAGDTKTHTSLVVPSLSFDAEELAKIPGAPRYEERLLFSLIRLRDPRARVVYVTSQPLHPEIVDYYLSLLVGVSARSARSRLQIFCCYDGSARPLTEKILERPRLIERLRQAVGDPSCAYLTCFNSTPLEARLADSLGIPLNGCDPELLDLGSKSGSREIFHAAGVPHPPGRERVRSVDEVLDALEALWETDLERAVIKLDQSFAGAGNAIFTYPRERPLAGQRREVLRAALDNLRFTEPSRPEVFLAKLSVMGGVVEAMVSGEEVRSPSVQMRLTPTGELELVSTHDQILGGATGQSYAGCRFPAELAYRRQLQEHAWAIGRLLRDRGVISRFAVDFVVTRDAAGDWQAWAIEINLRMGGTTVPYLALQFLTGGEIDRSDGEFRDREGLRKFYRATDSLSSPAYRGLLPEDLMDILDANGLGFSPGRRIGVLFHMMGALSEHGKVGVTAIGDSPEEAEALFSRTVAVLDHETGAVASRSGAALPDAVLPDADLLDGGAVRMPME